MAVNLAVAQISQSFPQLLHVDGGVNATYKQVYSAVGVASALRISTLGVAGGNISLVGSVISALEDEDMQITPHTGRNLLLTRAVLLDSEVPFSAVKNRAYAEFYDNGAANQTGSVTARTAVKFPTPRVSGYGVTVVSNSRITVAYAGVYRVTAKLQVVNTANQVHTLNLWFAVNGDVVDNTATRIAVPATSDGGTVMVPLELLQELEANDYVEVFWYPSNTAIELQYIAPAAAVVGVTPAIPAVVPAKLEIAREA